MFVYRIETPRNCCLFTASDLDGQLDQLRQDLLKIYGLDYQSDICYGYYKPEIHLICHNFIPLTKDDWRPQFSFKVWADTGGIYLDGLRLPKELRNKGIGTLCTGWLKNLGERYGLTYIVLGSYSESESFWVKMGFDEITHEEYVTKYPVW